MIAFVGGLGNAHSLSRSLQSSYTFVCRALSVITSCCLSRYLYACLPAYLSLSLHMHLFFLSFFLTLLSLPLLSPLLPSPPLSSLFSPLLHPSLLHPHIYPLQPICVPLGLRKAEALKQSIRRKTTSLVSRNELLEKKLMNPVVWTNAIGDSAQHYYYHPFLINHTSLLPLFLTSQFFSSLLTTSLFALFLNPSKSSFCHDPYLSATPFLSSYYSPVVTSPLSSPHLFSLPITTGFLRIADSVADQQLDPLDNTRIHPECYVTYDFAPKICADALEVDANPRWDAC